MPGDPVDAARPLSIAPPLSGSSVPLVDRIEAGGRFGYVLPMQAPLLGRVRIGRVLRSPTSLLVYLVVLMAATLTGPTIARAPGIDVGRDSMLGGLEFVAFPLSLVVAAILILVGRRSLVIAAIAILPACGLTLCQPFGVVAHAIPVSQVRGTTGTDTPLAAWFAPLRVRAYLRPTICINKDGGCDADTDVMVRSWLVPGLLNDAVAVSPGEPHEAPRLGRTPRGTAAVAVASDEAYELGYGIASKSGLVYWAVAALLIIAASRRLRSEPGNPLPRPRLW